MRAPWTGDVVGKMHISEITNDDLSKEMGCTKAYVSMILNGLRNPPNAQERVEKALERCIAQRSRMRR